MFQTGDGGRTWAKKVYVGSFSCVVCIDASHAWVVSSGHYCRTTDGGLTGSRVLGRGAS